MLINEEICSKIVFISLYDKEIVYDGRRKKENAFGRALCNCTCTGKASL